MEKISYSCNKSEFCCIIIVKVVKTAETDNAKEGEKEYESK